MVDRQHDTDDGSEESLTFEQDNSGTSVDDIELEETDELQAAKIKKLRDELKACEAEKRTIQEETQRARADFLNARKRLEEERQQDKYRGIKNHVENLLPLCDSFNMAMSNKESWENVDKSWRIGIESIKRQLDGLLASYGVTPIHPLGEMFDPNNHEALKTTPVDDEDKHHKILSVIQYGYSMTNGTDTEILRPARVEVGEYAH